MNSSDISALNQFDPKKGLYLAVTGKGKEQHLIIKKTHWLSRWIVQLFMKLGCHPASFSKVLRYLDKNKESLLVSAEKREELRAVLTGNLLGRVKKYNSRHAKKGSESLVKALSSLGKESVAKQEVAVTGREGAEKPAAVPVKKVKEKQEPMVFLPGQFRKSEEGERPTKSWMGVKTGNYTAYETDKDRSFAFVSCFHSIESHESIQSTLDSLCKAWDQKKTGFTETLQKLYNNLVEVHNALPGEPSTKSVKIYWSEGVEKVLFPHFFKSETLNTEDLVFAIIGGQECESEFQAEGINFKKQLHFVGIGRKEIEGTLEKDIAALSQELFSENILSRSIGLPVEENPLMTRAVAFTFRNNLRNELLKMKGTKISDKEKTIQKLLQSSQVAV